jgi:transcriptional regulator with XRE-family HTH domain
VPGQRERRSDSPLLPKEVGERLRLLRIRAGLSQEAVALLLGLNQRTGKAQVSKMETGHYESGPGFVRLLDYLRACGAGIDSLLDILDRHTSREPVSEARASEAVLAAIVHMPKRWQRRAFYYHVGLTHKARQRVRSAVAAAQRVKQSVARGRTEAWEQRLRRLFNDEFNTLHLACGHTLAAHLRAYGRLVFATLRRMRRAKPGWRKRAMARLDDWPMRYELEPAPFRRMKVAVMRLFEKLERSGALDRGRS